MSSIKQHPLYPFIRIGLAFDFHPDWANYPEGVVDNNWQITVVGAYLSSSSYESEAAAMADVDSVLFQAWNFDLVEQQIELAQERGDWALFRRLVEGIARAEGYKQAERDIATKLAPLSKTLAHFIHRVNGS